MAINLLSQRAGIRGIRSKKVVCKEEYLEKLPISYNVNFGGIKKVDSIKEKEATRGNSR